MREPQVKIKAFSIPEALCMPWPFAPVQYSCAEAATKWPCLKSQPLHSRWFSGRKKKNKTCLLIRYGQVIGHGHKNPTGFQELFPRLHGLGDRGGNYVRWVTPSYVVGARHVIQGMRLRARYGWRSPAPSRAGLSPLIMWGGNSVCPMWA